ncbi:hypothetical protein KGD82_27810 (plasmid) [Nocardiopsis eucommiae]|uniref:Type IV secretion system protein n=1 Tax=Nocardiopsis eucommiae TaxID=2831970 RepID=A0A975LCK3_9ACTN|nr:hypothetical protein KGD82_27810 [Nocardiopsis eucommiae]
MADESCSTGDFVSDLKGCLESSLGDLRDSILGEIGNAIRDTVTGETESALEGLANVINEQVAKTLDALMGWIVADSKIDLLSGSANATITRMDSYLSPLVLAIAVIAVLVAATKMILTRKANPLLPVGQGIFVVIVVQAIGIPLADLLIRFFDIWSEWVITDAREQGVDERLIEVMTFGQYSGGELDPDANIAGMWAGVILVIIFGIVVLFVAAIQIILMIFREAVLIILAAMLPLAAVGMLMQSTASWLQKVVSWMLSLILYKPTVATIYAITFIFIAEGNDLNTYLAGMMMLLISLFALKALLSLFSWATGSAAGGGGMGAAAMGGMAGGMVGSGTGASGGGGGGSAPSNQAADTNQRLGNAEGGGGSGGGSGGGGSSNAPTGAKPEASGQPTSNVPGSGGQDKGGGEGAPDGAKPSQKSATSDAGVMGGATAAGGPAGAALAAGAKAVETGAKAAEGAVSDISTPLTRKAPDE